MPTHPASPLSHLKRILGKTPRHSVQATNHIFPYHRMLQRNSLKPIRTKVHKDARPTLDLQHTNFTVITQLDVDGKGLMHTKDKRQLCR